MIAIKARCLVDTRLFDVNNKSVLTIDSTCYGFIDGLGTLNASYEYSDNNICFQPLSKKQYEIIEKFEFDTRENKQDKEEGSAATKFATIRELIGQDIDTITFK